MSRFQLTKIWLSELTGLPKDALHIYGGLIVFFLAALLLRKPLRSWVPLGATVIAVLIGEAWDVFDTFSAGEEIAWLHGWHDVWNTAFWPAVLFLLARYTRLLKR